MVDDVRSNRFLIKIWNIPVVTKLLIPIPLVSIDQYL